MIGGYMADHRHIEPVKADVRIVIVEIRDTLFFALPASIFAYIMSGGSSRNQGKVNRHP